MKKLIAVFLSVLLFPMGTWAQSLADRVVEHTLFNGLKILLVERHQVPTISFRIVYKVGGVDEELGMTGVAHLYEHMAFKGTEKIGTKNFEKEKILLEAIERLKARIAQEKEKGRDVLPRLLNELDAEFKLMEKAAGKWVVPNELGEIYDRNGASGFNASTGKDVTTYLVSFPANRLPLWIAIESDRMAKPVLREFYKERDVVLEERRRSVETSPGGKLYEAFLSTAFAAHPYGSPILGWPSDVGMLTATKTAEFFKTYYGPSNTIIAIVGDFKAEAVIPLLEDSFGKIPSAPPPPLVTTLEPPQRGELRVEVEDDAHPRLLIGFHKPNLHHPDDPVFDVIDSLLSMGRTSRLYKNLVLEKKIVVSVSTGSGTPGARFANLFTVSATPRAPHSTREVEEAIYEELNRLITEPPTEKELKKVITNIDASLIRSLRSNSGLAGRLAFFEAVAGDWRYTLKNRDAIAKVTAEDVVRVARTYFVKKNRTVATLVKQVDETKGDKPNKGENR